MRVVEVCFSPTGGTRRAANVVARALAHELGAGTPVAHDLTGPGADASRVTLGAGDLVLLAVPSFAGRVPAVAAERLARLRGSGALAVLVCAYGNRAFEDTLVELQDLAEAADLLPVAGIAAVTEHSIARRIAAGRPDDSDERALASLAARVAEKVAQLPEGVRPASPELPGSRPYKDARPTGPVPAPTDACVRCGACARACPVGAIDARGPALADAARCVSCMRCVSICPHDARRADAGELAAIESRLAPLCSVRKEPELFL